MPAGRVESSNRGNACVRYARAGLRAGIAAPVGWQAYPMGEGQLPTGSRGRNTMLDERLTSVRYRNFRSFLDERVQLGDLTVLVGPNGAGKSNFVEGLRFLRDALRGLDEAMLQRGGIGNVRRKVSHGGRPPDLEIGVEATIGDARFSYSVTIGTVAGGDWRLKRETCWRRNPGARTLSFSREGDRIQYKGLRDNDPIRRREYMPEDRLALPLVGRPFRDLSRFLTDVGAYGIYPDLLREPQRLLRTGRLDDDAGNLASILRRLRKRRADPAAGRIREVLSDVVPDVTNLRVTEPGSFLAIGLATDRNGKDMWFDAAQLSDGTLRLLAILTALYQTPVPSLVAIEEPELTVHPGAAAVLTDELVEAAHRMQVIVTTHSPDLVARVPLDSLRVVEATATGTKVGRVSSDQVDAVNEKLFSPGDLMRIDGLRRELAVTR